MIVKKQYRLTKDADFKKVISVNHVHKNRFFVIYQQKNSYGYPRVGISVSKKLGNAVKRNRIRRQIRAMMHAILNYQEAFDFLIIVRLEYSIDQYETTAAKLKELIDAIRSTTYE